METVQTSTTRIDVTHADVEAWITAHAGDLHPANVRVRRPSMRPGPDVAVELVWGVTKDYLKTFLKTVIPTLPEAYTVQVVENDPNIAVRISWTS